MPWSFEVFCLWCACISIVLKLTWKSLLELLYQVLTPLLPLCRLLSIVLLAVQTRKKRRKTFDNYLNYSDRTRKTFQLQIETKFPRKDFFKSFPFFRFSRRSSAWSFNIFLFQQIMFLEKLFSSSCSRFNFKKEFFVPCYYGSN